MKSPKVTLSVAGTVYVPVRVADLKRLRAVEKAARDVISAVASETRPQTAWRTEIGRQLRALNKAVQP